MEKRKISLFFRERQGRKCSKPYIHNIPRAQGLLPTDGASLMIKKVMFTLVILSCSATLAAAYCSKEETLKLVEAGYSKHEIDRICRERNPPPVHHENRNLYGSWRGFYGYEGNSRRPDVPFHLVVTRQERDRFVGYIKEPQTFGSYNSQYLSSEINGRIDRENHVEFVKHYTGRGGVNHKVVYKGLLRKDTIKGRWLIPGGGSGTFVINREL